MRTIRYALIALSAAGVLATSATGVIAQSPVAGPDSAEPVPFTVRFIPSDSVRPATVTTEDGVTKEVGNWWAPVVVNASDPRLAGDLLVCGDSHRFGSSDGSPTVGTGTYRLVNDEGAWQGSGPFAEWIDPESGETISSSGGALVLAGEGAYSGLSAVLTFLPDWSDIRGFIFEGAPPAAPAPPPAD